MKEGTPGLVVRYWENRHRIGRLGAVSHRQATSLRSPREPSRCGQRIQGRRLRPLYGCRGVASAVVVGCTIRKRRCSDTLMKRRQSKPEAAISDEMMAFQHEFVGRGPDRIRTRIVEDLVIVRSLGVLTPAELQLSNSFEGRRLIKAMRQQVLEAGRPLLERIVQKHTGAEVISVHSDISTKSGEWLDVFVLDRSIEEE
jgi:uncharacterized protein YbcI